ncbi:MAG: porin [Burkholderiales bacterium]|nr:porin [Burkholderiales bacterium]
MNPQRTGLWLACLLAASPVMAQSTVTLYGRLDMSLSLQNRVFVNGKVTDKSVRAADSGGSNGTRVGFRGTEDLGGGLKAVFVLEEGIQADTGLLGQGGRAFGRQSYVGLEGAWGRLTAGRQYTPWFDTLSTADPFGNNFVGNSGNVEFANARVDNSLLYRSPRFGGFTLQVLTAYGEGTAQRQNNVALAYQNGPLWIGAAYGQAKLASRGSFSILGASYDFGPLRVYGNVTRLSDIDPTAQPAPVLSPGARGRSWLLGANAPLGAGQLMASVVGLDDQRKANRDARQYAVAYNYPLSKRTSLYAGVGRIVNRNGGVLTVNTPSYPGRGERQTQLGISQVF